MELSFTPQKLTKKTFESQQQAFELLLSDGAQMEHAWNQMHSFFVGASTSDIEQYKHTYWRWYVTLTWRRLMTFTPEEFVDIVVPQFPTALLIENDVWESLVFFLHNKGLNQQIMESMYRKVKEAFLASEWSLGEFEGKECQLKDIVLEIQRSESQNADTLAVARQAAKIQHLLFASDKDFETYAQYYKETQQEDAVQEFLGFIRFFLGVPSEDIYYLVESYMNPTAYGMEDPIEVAAKKYKQVEVDEEFEKELDELMGEDKEISEGKNKAVEPATPPPPPPQEQPVQPSEQETPVPEPPKSVETPPETLPTDYHAIKQMVQDRFMENTDGEIDNIQGVLALLGSMAEQYGDQQILELYYFDEGAGKFVWNKKLLQET